MIMDLCRASESPSWGGFAQEPSKKGTEGQAERQRLPEVGPRHAHGLERAGKQQNRGPC